MFVCTVSLEVVCHELLGVTEVFQYSRSYSKYPFLLSYKPLFCAFLITLLSVHVPGPIGLYAEGIEVHG